MISIFIILCYEIYLFVFHCRNAKLTWHLVIACFYCDFCVHFVHYSFIFSISLSYYSNVIALKKLLHWKVIPSKSYCIEKLFHSKVISLRKNIKIHKRIMVTVDTDWHSKHFCHVYFLNTTMSLHQFICSKLVLN